MTAPPVGELRPGLWPREPAGRAGLILAHLPDGQLTRPELGDRERVVGAKSGQSADYALAKNLVMRVKTLKTIEIPAHAHPRPLIFVFKGTPYAGQPPHSRESAV